MMSILVSLLLFVLFTSGALLTVGLKEDTYMRSCIEKERQALLDVKADLPYLTIYTVGWGSPELDCCKWVGVSCNNHTGHVIELDFTLAEDDMIIFLPGNKNVISPSLQVLNQLQHLNLNKVDFQLSPLPNFLGSMSNLRSLQISHANLGGPIPHQLANLSNLLHLDLSDNSITGSIPFSFGHFTSLTHLDLSQNKLESVIPNSFGNFSSLDNLDLSQNLLNGSLPNFERCSSLLNMSVAHNSLNGSMPDFTRCTLLEGVDLSNNLLNGNLSNSLGQLSNLKYLDVGHNYLRGSIPRFIRNPSLRCLDMSSNELSGNVPKSLGQVTNLEHVDFSFNILEGVISEVHFLNLTHLDYLDMSSNNLTLELSFNWRSPSQLSTIRLKSCKLGPAFPMWIQTQKSFEYLDISNARISDSIPTWFWNLSSSLRFMNLSSNELKGRLPDMGYLLQFFDGIPGMDLSNNHFEGSMPLMPALTMLNLSGNKFSGTLSFLCKMHKDLSFLDLSNNSLSGSLPDCWSKFRMSLVLINLSNNNLSGELPSSFGSLFYLRSLYLRTNAFVGELPMSLSKCANLNFVDLRENKLSGVIPGWIGENLKDLYVLVLGSNRFKGSLPSQICSLSNLQVLDMSNNGLSGDIPRCFGNFTAMTSGGSEYYMGGRYSYYSWFGGQICFISGAPLCYPSQLYGFYLDNTWVTWKGTRQTFGNSGMQLLKSIDLSRNNLSGKVPYEITSLHDLLSLNLSMNKLYGEVPKDMGLLKALESLDLSRNELSGNIPLSLAQLNFLSYLDLSFNNLSGRIPSGPQLQRFDYTSYIGNARLFGPPLTPQHGFPPPPRKKNVEEEEDDYWTAYFTGLGSGFLVGFLGFCGALVSNRGCRYFFFALLTHMKDWIYVTVAVALGKLERKFKR